jgi:hypothetical protein
VVAATVGWVGVWGFWAGPGLVWMGFGVFAAVLLWGGRLLAAGHQSSSVVSLCWRGGAMRGGAVAGGLLHGRPLDGASCSRRAGLQQCKSFVEMCIVSC